MRRLLDFLTSRWALVFSIVLSVVLGFFQPPAQAQTATQATASSTSDAVNSGVGLNTGYNDATSWSLLFPAVNPAMSSGTECATHGTQTWGVVWNFFHLSTPQHGFDANCAMLKTVDFYGRKCMFYTAKVLMDNHARQAYGISPEQQTGGDRLAYDKWVMENFKDRSFEECLPPTSAGVKPTAEPVVVPVAVPSPAPVVRETLTRTLTYRTLNLNAITLFRTGKWDLTAEGERTLAKAMAIFTPAKDVVAVVEGHTDDVGSVQSNQRLSEQRAQAVGAYLEKLGFTVEKTVGHGMSQPLFPGKDATARAGNRRTTVTVRQSTEQLNAQ